jgi:hypothetical protein
MKILFRVLSVLVGLAMFANGTRFLLDPAGQAASLGMELLTGVGASTQIGDIGALFLSIALFVGLAQRTGGAHWLLPAAVLLGATAVVRTLAALIGHAAFAPQFILPEVVMATILGIAARLRRDERERA